MNEAAEPLPVGWIEVRELARGTQGRVVLAERDGAAGRELAVVRVVRRDRPSADELAELAVLARVRHPGLARLVDHGELPGHGGLYTIRTWIEGQDLAAVAQPLRARGEGGLREIGALVARLCPALDALHRAGFTHGDLKAGNVIVATDGAPVLTDFGLARAHDGSTRAAGVSGTLFAIAPEVLLGLRSDARADLFALGALLHELLLGRRASAREFYAAFPEQDFFAATRTRVEDLPEWARDVTERLLSRDPAQRPASALELARQLSARLGIALADLGEARIEWPVRRAREAFFTQWIEDLRAAFHHAAEAMERRSALSPAWIRVEPDEDAGDVVEELRLALALAGSPSARLDLGRNGQGLGDGLSLDHWLRERASTARGAITFVALQQPTAWDVRRVDGLARALALRDPSASGDPPQQGVVAPAAAPSSAMGWRSSVLAAVARRDLAHELARELEDDARRIDELADVLHAASGGSAALLDALLEGLSDAGAFVRGERTRRLRPGPIELPRNGAGSRGAPDGALLSPAARELFAALVVCNGRATLAELAELLERPLADLADAHAELARLRWLAARAERGDFDLRARSLDTTQLGLGEPRWRELHARRAAALRGAGAHASEWLPHAWRAAPGAESSARVGEELRNLREVGLAERAIALYEATRVLAAAADLPLDAELAAEAALAWISLGRAERALELAALLDSDSRPGHRATAEAVRGDVAVLRSDWNAAQACFDRARALDPSGATAWLRGLAALAWEAGRDAEIDALWSAVVRGEYGAVAPRVAAALANVRAMSLFRRGDSAGARAALEENLAVAERERDDLRAAALHVNLATVARRSGGDLGDAQAHAEHAVRLHEAKGNVHGLAQARALLAGVLRERGELARATPLLVSSHEQRERLGDTSGAATVRGNLGLLLADRGHVFAAQQELEFAAQAARVAGRSVHASLFATRAAEMRARFRSDVRPARAGKSESERAAEADPRILVSLARAAWLGGDVSEAGRQAQRARGLAVRLAQPQPEAEARLVLAWLRRIGERGIDPADALPVADEASAAPLVHSDRAVLDLLAGDFADPRHGDAVWSRAKELAERGRDDRAARLALAWLARCSTGTSSLASDVRGLFDVCLAHCGAGLGANELERLRGTLLGIPDPWPGDLAWRPSSASTNEELDMDVVTLLDINHKLVKQEALKDLLGTIVESALAVTGAERGFLVLDEDGELSFDTALDSRRGDIAAPDLEVSTSIVRQTLDAGRVLRLSNAVDDPLLGSAPSVSALELRSILCAPVAVDERLRGVIYLDHRLQQGAFAERAERLLALLADQAALAIRQVRRLEDIKRLNRELSKQMAHKESDLQTARAALRDAHVALPAGGMVGNSPAMRAVHALVERAAPAKLAVLVSGESGTGKELVARALHSLSPRRGGPFVSENCAALPAALIESELFGYKRGAFTGAEQDRQGLFERAHGGTLFLDEIGELPLELQAKLLRVLETGEVRRVGDANVRTVDFRLVAATNRDLAAEIAAGKFRADLYYRLDGLRIALPPLAERVEDIPALVEHFLRIESAKSGRERKLAPAVMSKLCRRAWPGNVRELANEVARLCVLSEGDVVAPELVREPGTAPAAERGANALLSGELPTMDELERRAILRALELADGDKRKAAEMLGISRAKVYQRLKEWRGGPGDDGDA